MCGLSLKTQERKRGEKLLFHQSPFAGSSDETKENDQLLDLNKF